MKSDVFPLGIVARYVFYGDSIYIFCRCVQKVLMFCLFCNSLKVSPFFVYSFVFSELHRFEAQEIEEVEEAEAYSRGEGGMSYHVCRLAVAVSGSSPPSGLVALSALV